MADNYKDYFIEGYRANPKNRYGAKDFMETLPISYEKKRIKNYVDAMKAGKDLGVPQLDSKQLAIMMLKEGKGAEDFGYRYYDSNNKKAASIVKALQDKGIDPEHAGFAGAIYDLSADAKRLNKPFEELWQGTGTNKYGLTGKDYSQDIENTRYATLHPKNKELVEYLNRIIDDKLTPREKVINKITDFENSNELLMGMDPVDYRNHLIQNVKDPNAIKMLQQSDPNVIASIAHNQLQNMFGMQKDNLMENNIFGDILYQAPSPDRITNTSLAMEFPEIKAIMDKSVTNAASKIKKAVPEYFAGGKVKLPDGYKQGGSSSLI
jgi:hypothetical protein